MKRPVPGWGFRLSALLALVGLASACNNIWEWTTDSESFGALMSDGREAIQAADYERAEEKFTAAVGLRPQHSEARYYLAKAAVLNGGVDVFSLVQTLTDTSTDNGARTIFGFPIDTANSIYGVNFVVLENLEPIHQGEATEGEFANADVGLDLAVAYTLSAILRLRDTNGDGIIDDNDVSLEDLGLLGGGDEDFSLDGIDNIPPDDLNDMIDDMGDLLGDGGELLGDLVGDSGVDVDELDELIDSLGGDISSFYVNTGEPGNPGEGDNDGDGTVDEECLNGIDDDGDGVTDEDSRVLGCPAS